MKRLICHLFGHKYLYNFKTLPNKCICSRCKAKFSYSITNYDIMNSEWNKIDKFPNENRTDEELIKKWVKP